MVGLHLENKSFRYEDLADFWFTCHDGAAHSRQAIRHAIVCEFEFWGPVLQLLR